MVVHYRSSNLYQTRLYKCELINRAAGVRERDVEYKQILISFGRKTKKPMCVLVWQPWITPELQIMIYHLE